MTAQKQRITRQLEGMGAGWVFGPDKYRFDAECLPAYHIFPDLESPRQAHFATLLLLEAWIRERRPRKRRDDAPARDWPHTTLALPDQWRKELKRRFGNVQAAIEQLVENELGPMESKEKSNG